MGMVFFFYSHRGVSQFLARDGENIVENSRCVFMYDCCKQILIIFKVMESLPQSQPFHPLSFNIHPNRLHHTPSCQLPFISVYILIHSLLPFICAKIHFCLIFLLLAWTHSVDRQCLSHLPRWVTPSLPELSLRNLSNLISPPLFHFLPFALIRVSQQSPDPGAEHLSHDSGQLSPKPPALWFSVHLQICLSSLPAVYRLSLRLCVFIASGWLQSRNWNCMTWSCQSGPVGGGGSRHLVLGSYAGHHLPFCLKQIKLHCSTLVNMEQINKENYILVFLWTCYLCTHRGSGLDCSRQSTFSNV